ncbi:hypothetical protein MY04_4562 [Flammeovirga sp. MY04]|uniref:hypothetical protein n=1 Tax=Flammeovirga sp. MY04 TaxID=1191459 RepID=UPI0013052268|nr:hypothetical protein [Flammeovirga sp. MY04]ANQ51897.2 hypothetical protein MY04_4562 [Flammeovirga sp. MY04]
MKKTIISNILLMASSLLFAQEKVDFSKLDSERIESVPTVKWEQFGPGGSGNNYHIYWHPTDPNTVYQGPNMGNSYRSTDRGETYEGIMDPDGPSYKTRRRGPVEIYAPEFSRQDENFGICTIEDANFMYFTYDKGKTWKINELVSAQFENIHVNTIKVDPTDDNVWYAGAGNIRDCNHFFHTNKHPHGVFGTKTKVGKAGEGNDGNPNYGHQARIWKSTDKGQTWKNITPKGIDTKAQITRIFVHPAQPQTVFAATTFGLYKSENGGKSWKQKVKSGMDNDIIRSMDMYYNAASKKVILYAIDLVKYIPNGNTIDYNGGVYKSEDEGESWVNINSDMPINKAIMKNPNIQKGYYKFALGKWFGISANEAKKKYPKAPEQLMHSVSMIRVNPTNPNHLLVINNYKSQFTFPGGMLWRSDDGGKHWYVTLRNGKDWNGRDKAHWEARNNPTSINVDWIGQDEWEERDAYDRKAGAVAEFNADGSTIMYQVAKVVCVSNDNGDTWLENDEKETKPGNHHWVGAGNSNLPGEEIIQDERIKDHLYLCAGENSIFKTTNDGDLVRKGAQAVYKISIPNKQKPAECSVGSMAIHPNDVNHMYALHFRQAYFGQLMETKDGGQNWAPKGRIFEPTDFGNPLNMIIHQSHLRIDPVETEHLYFVIPKKRVVHNVKFKGGKFKDFGIYRSQDGGQTFDIINAGLPKNGHVQKIEFDPENKGDLYAAVMGKKGQEGGLFKLNKKKTVWEAIDLPKGIVSVHDVHFSKNNKLYITAGTFDGAHKHGGVWVRSKGQWKQLIPYKFASIVTTAKYNPNIVLAAIPSDGSMDMMNPGIYRSLDAGKTWTKINTGNIQSDRINALEIDYHKKGVYYCSTYGAGYYIAYDEETK